MTKTLISFLGTGSLEKNDSNGSLKSSRQYRTSKYRIENAEYDSPFISDALRRHFNYDQHIIIGTVRSMWEEAYRVFAGEDNINADIYLSLSEFCINANHKTKLDEFPYKNELESVFGNNGKVILIHYGISQQEIEQNTRIIAGIEQYLAYDTEISLDITHSFRSLPLYFMNLLIYLETVSKKRLKVDAIYYGMLDVYRELNYAPVVDLSSVLKMNKWITGAYLFKEYGNARLISSLMEQENKSLATQLKNYSEANSINSVTAIKQEVKKLAALKFDTLSPIPAMIIPDAVGEFVDAFKDIEVFSLFQYELAGWHYRKGNFGLAYMMLAEAVITRECEIRGYDIDQVKSRSMAKKEMKKDSYKYRSMFEIYSSVNDTRNIIAHSLENDKKIRNMIDDFQRYYKELESLFK
ncbi:MAG: TIGR02221 family CRISPR-associated protein [Bacteroidales bacterium]|nr:TIGR02221 family CRISPR-associated protein [Bacteroidales bacterium]